MTHGTRRTSLYVRIRDAIMMMKISPFSNEKRWAGLGTLPLISSLPADDDGGVRSAAATPSIC